jgi:mRNA-degrading endonuclease RelE of RelBE toxin-antitoxin system
MATIQPYTLIYDIKARQHLARIERKYHSLIREKIEEFLTREPDKETRNRKPLSRPSVLGTAWELRCGPDNRFPVYYRVNRESRHVYILAIGVKERARVLIGGEEFES